MSHAVIGEFQKLCLKMVIKMILQILRTKTATHPTAAAEVHTV